MDSGCRQGSPHARPPNARGRAPSPTWHVRSRPRRRPLLFVSSASPSLCPRTCSRRARSLLECHSSDGSHQSACGREQAGAWDSCHFLPLVSRPILTHPWWSRHSLTCRSRKLKCDEKKPQCTQCRKGSRECRPSEGIVFRHQQNASMNKDLDSSGGRGSLKYFYAYKNTFDDDNVWLDIPKHGTGAPDYQSLLLARICPVDGVSSNLRRQLRSLR